MTITILDGGMATTLERTFHKDLSGKNAITSKIAYQHMYITNKGN
jgi:hypothetical protein